MALSRQEERQTELMVGWAELPRSPGHAFYDRLQAILVEAGFDRFIESACAPYYAFGRGRPSIQPGRYFRMHLILLCHKSDGDEVGVAMAAYRCWQHGQRGS